MMSPVVLLSTNVKNKLDSFSKYNFSDSRLNAFSLKKNGNEPDPFLRIHLFVIYNCFLVLAEFQRAVKISTGFELEQNIIALIFRIFDVDDDQHL